MGFGQAVSSGFKKYATFNGRASRSEFWWWYLFTIIASLAANVIDALMDKGLWKVTKTADGMTQLSYSNVGIVAAVVTLALLLPTIAVTVRRLHDTDHSGWWWWLGVICCIGPIILIFAFLIQRGTPGENRFGPPPM